MVRIGEVDVVGAIKRLRLALPLRATAGAPLQPLVTRGRPVPATVAPPGTRLLARFRVANWIVARFELTHPIRVNIHRLIKLAPRYFRLTPRSLLLFFQQPGR
jgi:hypothetical protein